MKLEPIIRSLLDTDLYKFTMNQVMFHRHTNLTGTYIFKCRMPQFLISKLLQLAFDAFGNVS